jgi:hypothetical protein
VPRVARAGAFVIALFIANPGSALDATSPEVVGAYAGPATEAKLDTALRGFEDLLETLRSRPSGPPIGAVFSNDGVLLPNDFFFLSPSITVLSILDAASDADLGAPGDPLVLDQGRLNALASFASSRPVTIGTGGAIIDTGSFTLALHGHLMATGVLLKQGGGVLELNGVNAWRAMLESSVRVN